MTATATETTATEAIRYVLDSATDDDLQRIFDACRQRQRTLTAIAAAAVTVGAAVQLTNLSPKALNGLAGTVESIHGTRSDVQLDNQSTRVLAFSRSKLSVAASLAVQNGEPYVLRGVPTGCLRIAE